MQDIISLKTNDKLLLVFTIVFKKEIMLTLQNIAYLQPDKDVWF